MRDGDEGAVANLLAQALQQGRFGTHVHGAGGLVKKQDAGLAEQGACNGDGLTLAAREALATFAQLEPIALGVLAHKVVHTRNAGRVQNFFVARVIAAQCNVLLDGAAHQPDVLKHHAQSAAQVGWVNLAHVNAVYQHRARIRLEQAQNQFGHSGFARTHLADDGHLFTRYYLERDAFQRWFGGAGVGEGDVSEFDGAFKSRPVHEHFAVLVFALLVHQLAQSPVTDQGLVHAGEQLGDLRDGGDGPTRQNGAGNDGAKAQLAVAHKKGAYRHHTNLHKLLRQIRHVGRKLRQHA